MFQILKPYKGSTNIRFRKTKLMGSCKDTLASLELGLVHCRELKFIIFFSVLKHFKYILIYNII